METSLLPIGSVVEINGVSNKIIIIGFSGIKIKNSSKTYDYIGCLYPQGFIDRKKVILFEAKNVKKIWYVGYQTVENQEFLNILKNVKEEKI